MSAKFKFKGIMKNTTQVLEGYYLYQEGKHFILTENESKHILTTEVEKDGIEMIYPVLNN